MDCRNPYVKGRSAYPCGRCAPCLEQRRRLWTHRITLEAGEHKHNAFVTLTYDDEHLPKDGSLAPETTRNWLKRLRQAVEPARFRYYLVGEYGDQTKRPHYHAALFGFPTCLRGRTDYSGGREECCHVCSLVRDTWGYGNVYLGTLSPQAAAYVSGYVTKKMTRFDDPRLPPGHHPEFCRMSLKPGIGATAMADVADVLMRFNLVDPQGDVPSSLRHGPRIMPLGRYLRQVLRQNVGMDKKAPASTLLEIEASVLAVLQAKGIDLEKLPGEVRKTAIKNALIDESTQRVINKATRREIFKQQRKI